MSVFFLNCMAKYCDWYIVNLSGLDVLLLFIYRRILLADLVRLCQSTAAQFPDAITDRRLIHTPYVNTNYTFKGRFISQLN